MSQEAEENKFLPPDVHAQANFFRSLRQKLIKARFTRYMCVCKKRM